MYVTPPTSYQATGTTSIRIFLHLKNMSLFVFTFFSILATLTNQVIGYQYQLAIGHEATEPYRHMVAQNFDQAKPNLTIPLTAFVSGYVFPIGQLCETSIQIALDEISKQNVLKNYNLVIDLFDEQCDPALGVRLAVEIMNRAKTNYTDMPPLLIGPACVDATMIGQFVKNYNFVTAIHYTSISPIYYARQAYSNAFVISPSVDASYASLPHFIKANGWSKVYIFSDSMSFWLNVS